MDLDLCRRSLDLSIQSYLNPSVVVDEDAVLILKEGRQLFLSFRGTLSPTIQSVNDAIDSLQDWLNDSEMLLVKVHYSQGLVHHGFNDSLNKLWPVIVPFIDDVDSIYITGHSKGGAIANLCALRLSSLGKNVVGVYTFGAAKSGDYNHSLYYDSIFYDKHFRFVNQCDIVPSLPPTLYLLRLLSVLPKVGKLISRLSNIIEYSQVGQLFRINCKGKIYSRNFSLRWIFDPDCFIEDHFTLNYKKSLDSIS
jgi:predicted lipase